MEYIRTAIVKLQLAVLRFISKDLSDARCLLIAIGIYPGARILAGRQNAPKAVLRECPPNIKS